LRCGRRFFRYCGSSEVADSEFLGNTPTSVTFCE
jgi:hypothetical protein